MTTTRPQAARLKLVAAMAVMALISAGCLYFPNAIRTTAYSGGTSQPWFCQSGPAITVSQCHDLAFDFDVLLAIAGNYPTVATATTAGATRVPGTPDGVGSVYLRAGSPTAFNPLNAQALIYTGSTPTDRLAGVGHLVTTGPAAGPPEGYPGSRDVWVEIDPVAGTWLLPVWIVRGYLNHPDVFASSHPCLEPGVTLTATTDQCFLESQPLPLQVLVTNDDGIGAAGIDALVVGLQAVPGIDITVIAPATNQSGTGDRTTPGGVTSSPATTASGFSGLAVAGTPGDSVLHAVNVQHEVPDLVVSGINDGQNMGPVIAASGTVGAARIAARIGLPSVATSQGSLTVAPDFPSGVTATLAWIERFRLGLAGPPFMAVANINTPSCAPGTSIRGTVETVVATSIGSRNYLAQDCASTVTVINDDIDAFNHGFVGIADAGLR